MSERRIMYVCSDCADGNPEGCGHYDPEDLRVMPDGRWLCETCFDDTTQIERGNTDGETIGDRSIGWSDLPAPCEYRAVRIEDLQEQIRALETALAEWKALAIQWAKNNETAPEQDK